MTSVSADSLLSKILPDLTLLATTHPDKTLFKSIFKPECKPDATPDQDSALSRIWSVKDQAERELSGIALALFHSRLKDFVSAAKHIAFPPNADCVSLLSKRNLQWLVNQQHITLQDALSLPPRQVQRIELLGDSALKNLLRDGKTLAQILQEQQTIMEIHN